MRRLVALPPHRQPENNLCGVTPKIPMKDVGRITDYVFTKADFHPAADAPYPQTKFLRPDNINATLHKRDLVKYFVGRVLDEKHATESKALGGRRMNKRNTDNSWEERVKRFHPGYDGDFHLASANPGYGRTPYGGHFTNFK